MANHMKGELELTVGGDIYILHYTFDTLVGLEKRLGMGFPKIARTLASPDDLTLAMVREIVYAGLRKHHPNVDLLAAGELIVAAGGVLPILKSVDQAMSYAFNGQEASEDQNPPQEAQKTSNGIGLNS